jgi:hypothetical protein
MADQDDVRQIALSLPGARETEGRFAFTAVRVHDRVEKRALLASDRQKFFTEPHYDGFPAVLVRLPAITKRELRKLIVNAWRCQAPPAAQDPAPTKRSLVRGRGDGRPLPRRQIREG